MHVYYGLIEAVKGIDFKVETGHIVSLIGSNGAGKTSTLNALLNAVKRTGEINFRLWYKKASNSYFGAKRYSFSAWRKARFYQS